MMICTKCQEIYDKDYDNTQFRGLCPKNHCSGEVVWIDENMVLPCKRLWDKGYITHYTCEGHYMEWGGLPYITFSFDPGLIPELVQRKYDSDIMRKTTAIWADENLSVNWYAGVDYHKAENGEFKNDSDKEWWLKYGDIIRAIFKSDFCKDIFDHSVDHITINVGEFVTISIYFKSITCLLMEQHPEEDCECSELVKLHTEDNLFLMHLQHKTLCIMHLIEYIKSLPDLKNKS